MGSETPKHLREDWLMLLKLTEQQTEGAPGSDELGQGPFSPVAGPKNPPSLFVSV